MSAKLYDNVVWACLIVVMLSAIFFDELGSGLAIAIASIATVVILSLHFHYHFYSKRGQSHAAQKILAVKTVTLSEDEWGALCDRAIDSGTGEEKCTALPVCCANISDLRDQIIILRKNGGKLQEDNKRDLIEAFKWVRGSHGPDEWDWTILNKLMAQVLSAD